MFFNPLGSTFRTTKPFPNTRFLSNSLLDVRTDACRRHPMDVHALLIDVPMFTLHRELHLMPKWHAKAFITPFIIISAANLMDVRRPVDSGMESPWITTWYNYIVSAWEPWSLDRPPCWTPSSWENKTCQILPQKRKTRRTVEIHVVWPLWILWNWMIFDIKPDICVLGRFHLSADVADPCEELHIVHLLFGKRSACMTSICMQRGIGIRKPKHGSMTNTACDSHGSIYISKGIACAWKSTPGKVKSLFPKPTCVMSKPLHVISSRQRTNSWPEASWRMVRIGRGESIYTMNINEYWI